MNWRIRRLRHAHILECLRNEIAMRRLAEDVFINVLDCEIREENEGEESEGRA